MGDATVPPDLASILATLAQFAPQQQQQLEQTQPPPQSSVTTPTITDPRRQARQQVQNQHSYHQDQQNDHHPSSTSSSYNPKASVFQPINAPQLQPRSASQSQSIPSSQQQYEQNIIDPATITEWSAGLRCVTKMAAQNPLFADKIRGLINDQRRNEMQWYSSRQALKQMQAKRSTSSNELQSILASVGSTQTTNTPQTPLEKATELSAFDAKLYKAQLAMNDSMSNVLKSLGVPFFGTHAALILPDDDDKTDQGKSVGGVPVVKDVQGDNRPKWSPRVTKNELMELKRKMVVYLEDMYKT